MPACIGKTNSISGLKSALDQPEFATAIGLVISSVSNSRDQAAVIVPLALAPQLIFGSGLVSALSWYGEKLAQFVIGAYWTRQAMIAAGDGATPHSSENRTKRPTPPGNSRRAPYRRRSHPVSGAITAVAHR